MATVNALLVALYERTLESRTPRHSAPDPSLLDWNRLARNAIRCLDAVDPPPELVPILRAIVAETGVEGRDVDDTHPLTAIGYTLGVLADTLNSHPEVAALASHADRAQLRSCLLSSLYGAATDTVSALQGVDASVSDTNLIHTLADATEPASFVPWRPLASPLGRLAVGPGSDSFDQVVAAWAASATDVLGSRTSSTGYAFQRTAVSIAQLCLAAATTFGSAEDGLPGQQMKDALITACRDWQIAADWPPEVRLGGHATELRHRSQDLDEALTGAPLSTMAPRSRQDTLESAVLLADGVGKSHEAALTRVVTGGELWIVAHALGPSYLTRHPGTHRNDWVLAPATVYGTTLLQAARRAHSTLQEATVELTQMPRTREPDRSLSGPQWETVGIDSRVRRGTPTTPSVRARSINR